MGSNESVAYTRANGWRQAAKRVADLDNWDTLEGMRGAKRSGGYLHIDGDEYKVVVERIAQEPEEKWWSCKWSTAYGFETEPAPKYGLPETMTQIRFAGGELNEVIAWMLSTTSPTPEQFQAHVLAETGVEVPCVEEAHWWHWQDGEWNEAEAEMSYVAAYDYPWASRVRVNVYGTVSNRDEKRDALLEAVKAAGKPESEK